MCMFLLLVLPFLGESIDDEEDYEYGTEEDTRVCFHDAISSDWLLLMLLYIFRVDKSKESSPLVPAEIYPFILEI